LGNTWEQFALERFDRLTVRGIDDVRVDVQRRCDARVPDTAQSRSSLSRRVVLRLQADPQLVELRRIGNERHVHVAGRTRQCRRDLRGVRRSDRTRAHPKRPSDRRPSASHRRLRNFAGYTTISVVGVIVIRSGRMPGRRVGRTPREPVRTGWLGGNVVPAFEMNVAPVSLSVH